MIIGVPIEIKPFEYRVSIMPDGVESLTAGGHQVFIEAKAGKAAGIRDKAYKKSGAKILKYPEDIYQQADLILKVKEIFPEEFNLLKKGQILFTYIHSAARPEMTQALLDKKIIGIAYEDLQDEKGEFPLLTPMSDIAGEMGVLMGAQYMMTVNGGGGRLLGGYPGVAPARVMVIGAGNAGFSAARLARRMGADVTLFDINLERLKTIHQQILPGITTLSSTPANIRKNLPHADLLINAVMWPPTAKGHLISRDMLGLMKKDALIVDIPCDLGGAVETCRYSAFDEPVYEVDGIRHICISNLPSAVARTASQALCNLTLPYVKALADKGWFRAIKEDATLRRGLGFAKGYLTFKPTADTQNRPYTPPEEILRLFEGEMVS